MNDNERQRLGLKFDRNVTVSPRAEIIYEPPVALSAVEITSPTRIGAYTFLRGGRVRALGSIGRFCSVAPGLSIGDGGHPLEYVSTHPFSFDAKAFGFWPEYVEMVRTTPPPAQKNDPIIGNDVWIGANVTIMRGVTVGDGAVVGAGAIVTKDVAPYEVVGGVPAKHIKWRFPADIIAALVELKWWDYTLSSLSGINLENAAEAIALLHDRRASGRMEVNVPGWLRYSNSRIERL